MDTLMTFTILLEGFALTVQEGIFDPCYFWPESVYAGNGMCFKFVDDYKAFIGAQDACKADGATLAELRTEQQTDTAKSLINFYAEIWLGGRDPTGQFNFTWLSDGQRISSMIKDPGYIQGDGTEICLIMDSTYELATQSCLNHLRYICQIYAGNPCDVFLPGAEYFDSSCFLPVSEPLMTSQDATAYCEKLEAKVVEPITLTLLNYMVEFASRNFEPTSAVWIGLARDGLLFRWQSTGLELTSVTNWATGEPVLNVDHEIAVMNGISSWAWTLKSTSFAAHVICQRDIGTECTGVFSSGRCFTMHHGAIYWNDAKLSCEDIGTYLAEPKTEVLGRTVEKYADDNPDVVKLFLGATDLVQEGHYMWNFSQELLDDTYSNWAPSQPDHYLGLEHYVEYWSGTLGWNDIGLASNGATPHSFVCERFFPVYLHTYVLAIPREYWAGSLRYTNALLSAAPFPGQVGRNYVKIDTFPTEDVQTASLLDLQTFQYNINAKSLSLNASGVQHKYVIVKSTHPLDVQFFLWGKSLRYTCACLLMEELSSGVTSTFFIAPTQQDNNLAIVSTEKQSSNLTLFLSTDSDLVTFYHNSVDHKSRSILAMSTSIEEQYQSIYVESISGLLTAPMVQSTGALSVFRYAGENKTKTKDVSFEQTLPISMIGSDYVTVPSLPLTPYVIDYYTVIAIYSNTTVTLSSSEESQTITLRWPGDVYVFELPALHFYHVNGTKMFYLHAKLPSSVNGLCSMGILPSNLFRSSYLLTIVEPLTRMVEIYVLVIARTRDQGDIHLLTPNGVTESPDICKDVAGTERTGCYFYLTNPTENSVYTLKINSTSLPTFGAYAFSTNRGYNDALCFPLGRPNSKPAQLEYDLDEYTAAMESKQLCHDFTTTAPTVETPTIPVETTAAPQVTTPLVEEESTTGVDSSTEMALLGSTELVMSTETTTQVLDTTIFPTDIPLTNPGDISPTDSPPCQEIRLPRTNITFTPKELEEALEKIIVHLSVKSEQLSSVKRSKISAPDTRVSSTSMGCLGLAVIGLVVGLVIVSDFRKIVSDFRLYLA